MRKNLVSFIHSHFFTLLKRTSSLDHRNSLKLPTNPGKNAPLWCFQSSPAPTLTGMLPVKSQVRMQVRCSSRFATQRHHESPLTRNCFGFSEFLKDEGWCNKDRNGFLYFTTVSDVVKPSFIAKHLALLKHSDFYTALLDSRGL